MLKPQDRYRDGDRRSARVSARMLAWIRSRVQTGPLTLACAQRVASRGVCPSVGDSMAGKRVGVLLNGAAPAASVLTVL